MGVRRALTALLAAAALTACSGGGRHAGSAGPSLTPRVTTAPSAARLATGLLADGDVAGVRVVPADQAAVYQDPDPRSPCGRRLPLPAASGVAGVALEGEGAGGFEFLLPVGASRAAAYVAATRADSRPGCAAYQSRTNTGGVQTVRFVGPETTPDPRTESAALAQLTTDGHTVSAFELVAAHGDLLCVEVLLAAAPPAAPFLAQLVARTTARLAALPSR